MSDMEVPLLLCAIRAHERFGTPAPTIASHGNQLASPFLVPITGRRSRMDVQCGQSRTARTAGSSAREASPAPLVSGFLLRFGDRTHAQEPYRCPAVRVGRFPECNKAQLHRDAVCWTPNFAQRKGMTTARARHARYETVSFYRTRWSQRAAPHGREERGRSGHYARSRVPRDAHTQLGGHPHPVRRCLAASPARF